MATARSSVQRVRRAGDPRAVSRIRVVYRKDGRSVLAIAPLVPGFVTGGRTLEDAKRMVRSLLVDFEAHERERLQEGDEVGTLAEEVLAFKAKS